MTKTEKDCLHTCFQFLVHMCAEMTSRDPEKMVRYINEEFEKLKNEENASDVQF